MRLWHGLAIRMGWPAKLPRADAQSTMISSIDLAKTVGEADFMQVNVQDAGSQLSWLLELVEEGETVIIARHGEPVAELVPARRKAASRLASLAKNPSSRRGTTGGSR